MAAATPVALLAVCFGLPAQAADCAVGYGRVVAAEGQVEWRRAEAADWQPAPAEARLCPGDSVRVGPRSRAAVRLANQTTLRLDQLTTLTLPPADEPASLLGLLRGAVHVITRTPKPFKVQTPFLNAGVDGTEFIARVGSTSTEIQLIEGRLLLQADAAMLPLAGRSAATAGREAAPAPTTPARTVDALRWALHHPRLFGPRPVPPVLREAERLLRVGRADEAAALLAASYPVAPPPTLALQSLVATVQGDLDQARRLAVEAIAADGDLPAAHLALSYAEQARFDIPASRVAAERAAALDPDDAVAWARVAETRLASGDVEGALDAVRRAGQGEPPSRQRSVLGFVQLMRADATAAAAAFREAIALDPSDHLPRLGLGLALVRAGALADGREQIEIAVSLDPANAIVRSYLGKAYAEERRTAPAATQLELARELDPADPTPWLYAALLARQRNQPLQALADLQRSVALNDGRAVDRSRLLLDQDAAARQAGVAALYADVGAERDALALASRSVDEDPSNAGAHRVLSDLYALRERHDLARLGERLMAQLLQPPGLDAPPPELLFDELGLPSSFARAPMFAADAGSAFERERVQGDAGVLVGNLGTRAARARVGVLHGALAFNVGAFDYRTDGWRRDADLAHRIGSVLVQFAPSTQVTLLAEHRDRRSRHGDIGMAFDPAYDSPTQRVRFDQRATRVGAAWRPGPATTWVLASTRAARRYVDDFAIPGALDGRFDGDDRVTQHELQWQHRWSGGSVVAGAGRSRTREGFAFDLDYSPLGEPCPAFVAPCNGTSASALRQVNAYLYAHGRLTPALQATAGAALDRYENEAYHIRQWSPKLGLRWSAAPAVDLRLATFGSFKRSLSTQPSLEPTQVMGFNQQYDDVDGAISRFRVAAVDWRPDEHTSVGLEGGQQRARIGVGQLVGTGPLVDVQVQRTDWLRLDLSARGARSLVTTAAVIAERFRWDATLPTDAPTKLMTLRVPLTVRAFLPQGYFGELTVTGVTQHVQRLPSSALPVGRDHFALVDGSIGWRLPARSGTVSLDVKNLFGTRFSYQDNTFRNSEGRMSPYLPVRRMLLKASFTM